MEALQIRVIQPLLCKKSLSTVASYLDSKMGGFGSFEVSDTQWLELTSVREVGLTKTRYFVDMRHSQFAMSVGLNHVLPLSLTLKKIFLTTPICELKGVGAEGHKVGDLGK